MTDKLLEKSNREHVEWIREIVREEIDKYMEHINEYSYLRIVRSELTKDTKKSP